MIRARRRAPERGVHDRRQADVGRPRHSGIARSSVGPLPGRYRRMLGTEVVIEQLAELPDAVKPWL
jgi:hypothetical protein